MKFEFEYQCDRDWDEMHGGDRRRFCESCKEHVHHVSGMTKEEALQFLEEHDWNVCVDFYRNDDGHTVFREAAKKLRMQNDGLKQLLASAAAVIPLALAAAFMDFDTEPHQDAGRVIAETEADPIDLGGPRPVVSNEVPDIPTAPDFVEPADIHPVDTDPSPVVPETEESDPSPIVPEVEEEDGAPERIEHVNEDAKFVPPRPHVRGRIRPPADLNRDRLNPVLELD